MFTTIRSKFIFLAVLIIVAGISISNIFIINQLRDNFHKQTIIMLETTLDVLHNGLYNSMMSGKQKNIQLILDELAKNKKIDHIRIIDKSNIVKYASNKNEVGKNINNIAPQHFIIPKITRRVISPSEGSNIYSAREPILNESKCQWCHKNQNIIAYLDVDTNLKDAEGKFYSGALSILIISGMIITLLIFSFFILFNWLINKPLHNFIAALNSIKEGNLSIALPQHNKNEFGELNAHFNNMVKNLKDSKDKIEELHSEQLQRADRLVTLGELTAEMAHEINNHSAIIMSRADYLQLETLKEKNLEKYRHDLEAIVHQTSQVSKITGNILKHSKKQSKIRQELNLVEIAEDCLNILKPVIKKRNVEIVKNYSGEILLINGDQLDIEQVLMNLISNAIDACCDNCKIEINLVKNSEGKVVLTLKDNGEGIEQKIIDQIFLPFFTTKEPGKGTGLGLYIVKKICDNHSADIKCTSKRGEGTEFKITFGEI